MLNIKFREVEESKPLQALCPWIDFITPELVLNKDGSLLAAFRYSGVDPDNLNGAKVESVTSRFESACKQLDKRVTAWWILDKRRDYTYSQGEFVNETAAEIDQLYSKSFRAGKRYSMDYVLYLLFSGESGTSKFFDRVQNIQASGRPIGTALIEAVKESLSGRRSFARDTGVLRENIRTFKRILTAFTNTAPIKTRQLTKHNGFDRALATLLNRASDPIRHAKPDGSMLDSWAPANYVAASADTIQFTGNTRTVYAAALGVIKWPTTTSPMLFESLAKLDMEMTICQIVRFLNSKEATAEIQKAIEYYNLTQYNLVTHAVAKSTGAEPEPKPGRRKQLLECQDAQESIGAGGAGYCYHNLTVFIYGDSQTQLDDHVRTADTLLGQAEFGIIRERINALPSFCAMLPGQWAMQSRYDMLSLENVADCAPLYTIDEGTRVHEWYSDMVYRRNVPVVTTFGNQYLGRWNFTSHVGQVGHLLLIAPTGGGKTTFVNFIASQFQRYGKVYTYMFDRDYSCKIVTLLHDGTHIDLKSGKTRFNPLLPLIDGSDDGLLFCREYVLRRLTEGGYTPDADDRNSVDHALSQMQAQYDLHSHNGVPTLSKLAALLPMHLTNQLGEWLAGRPYGMFDNEEDDFSISDWTTIEMKDMMKVDRVAAAFMDYAFRKIYSKLDGTPTFIYLEEVTFLLKDPRFAAMIDDWLKTFRKKNAFIWMTIQSPESVSDSDIAATILDNIFSFLMLYNEKVEPHREAYKTYFALEEHHVDLIKMLTPKRDYLLVQNSDKGAGTQCRVITTDFSKEVLARLRSEQAVLKIFERHYATRATNRNWKQNYYDELLLEAA